jgi:hypothetical protein
MATPQYGAGPHTNINTAAQNTNGSVTFYTHHSTMDHITMEPSAKSPDIAQDVSEPIEAEKDVYSATHTLTMRQEPKKARVVVRGKEKGK